MQSLTSLEKGCSIIITKLKPPRVSIFKKFPKIATGAHVLFNMGHWAQKPSATEEKSTYATHQDNTDLDLNFSRLRFKARMHET